MIINKYKIFSNIIILLTIFSLGINTALAQLTTASPAVLPAAISGVPSSDYITQWNTNITGKNTYAIAASLSGALPGAQQDSKKSGIMMGVFKSILRQFTLSIVNWINNGFEGNPSFITNTQQFLLNTADITVGDFLMNDESLNFLCDPFKLQIKLAIGLQYRPFKEQIECSFTSAVGNVTDAMNNFTNGDFIGGGGWDSWLQMTTIPQNNQMGAMMIAQSELDARISGNKEIQLAEADWGGGFMSWKDCPLEADGEEGVYDESTDSVNGPNRLDRYSEVTGQQRGDNGCVIKTPGGVIANKINWADSSTIRELELSDNFNEIVYALANQVLLKGMGSLSTSGLLGNKKPTQNDTYNEYMAYLSSLDTQVNGVDTSGGYYNTDGSIDNTISYADKNIAIETINRQISVEEQYLTAQYNIQRLLDATIKTFTDSSCTTVKEDIINQINGNFTGFKDLSWNKKDVDLGLNGATSNLAILRSTLSSVSGANDSTIQQIVQPLKNMNTFHTYIEANSYSLNGAKNNTIKSWVVSKVNNNKSCIGNNISNLSEWGIQ